MNEVSAKPKDYKIKTRCADKQTTQAVRSNRTVKKVTWTKIRNFGTRR
jgi:hypothetical protein